MCSVKSLIRDAMALSWSEIELMAVTELCWLFARMSILIVWSVTAS